MWPAVLATPRGWPRAVGLVAGLDASENLIQVARARVPDAEFTVGDMFAMPFHGCNDRPRRNRPPWTRRGHASGLRIASGLPSSNPCQIRFMPAATLVTLPLDRSSVGSLT